jgi:hypothetical protein
MQIFKNYFFYSFESLLLANKEFSSFGKSNNLQLTENYFKNNIDTTLNNQILFTSGLEFYTLSKFTNEITIKSIKHFKGNSIKNIQLVDFAKIQDQPAVIFAKEEDNAIILCYSLISNLEELNQFSKIEFSEFQY